MFPDSAERIFSESCYLGFHRFYGNCFLGGAWSGLFTATGSILRYDFFSLLDDCRHRIANDCQPPWWWLWVQLGREVSPRYSLRESWYSNILAQALTSLQRPGSSHILTYISVFLVNSEHWKFVTTLWKIVGSYRQKASPVCFNWPFSGMYFRFKLFSYIMSTFL